jgi:hypothetical protein
MNIPYDPAAIVFGLLQNLPEHSPIFPPAGIEPL